MKNNYKRNRERANISAEKAASELGVSFYTLNNWESGKTSPDGEKLARMAKLYDCTADSLLALV